VHKKVKNKCVMLVVMPGSVMQYQHESKLRFTVQNIPYSVLHFSKMTACILHHLPMRAKENQNMLTSVQTLTPYSLFFRF